MDTNVIHKVREHCYRLINGSHCKDIPFHNWQHTVDVVDAVQCVGDNENVDPDNMELLIIAAYFHDIGNIKTAENHEALSCLHAETFLTAIGFSKKKIIEVVELISVTKLSQTPKSHLEKIMCDADLAHLGKKSFFIRNEALRNEWISINGVEFSNQEWYDLNIRFLENHTFHTSYAKNEYNKVKSENLLKLKNLSSCNRLTYSGID